MKVLIDTHGDILYKSFYIYGLIELFGSDAIKFSDDAFSSIPNTIRDGKEMNFIIQKGISEHRYTIACNDSYKIIPELYDWCDIYGSVNANFALTPREFQSKLVSLCPSFAICYNSAKSIILNCIQAIPNTTQLPTLRKHIGKYKRLLQRSPYKQYANQNIRKNNYIFHCSTLWYNDEWNKNDETVNLTRAHFIRACKNNPNIQFEGGLVSQGRSRSSEELFQDCLSSRCNFNEWILKTHMSAFVFNTPAFWNCHGWKFGEYMAMGKSIISTDISNDLPETLVSGTHYHLTHNSSEAISESIQYLLTHPNYCTSLEQNIQHYWEQNGTPTQSLRLLGINT